VGNSHRSPHFDGILGCFGSEWHRRHQNCGRAHVALKPTGWESDHSLSGGRRGRARWMQIRSSTQLSPSRSRSTKKQRPQWNYFMLLAAMETIVIATTDWHGSSSVEGVPRRRATARLTNPRPGDQPPCRIAGRVWSPQANRRILAAAAEPMSFSPWYRSRPPCETPWTPITRSACRLACKNSPLIGPGIHTACSDS
jgi:hypothetical protein